METLFELIGAFVFWMLSGFEGKYNDYLEGKAGYRSMWLGLVLFFVGGLAVILVVR